MLTGQQRQGDTEAALLRGDALDRVLDDPVEAQMAKGVLETAGVDCFLQGENANNLLGIAFRARLLVHRKDEAAAKSLLEPDSEEAVGEGMTDGE